jgi:hypothetical protein
MLSLAACSLGEAASDITVIQDPSTVSSGIQTSDSEQNPGLAVDPGAVSVTTLLAENQQTHEDGSDYIWDSASVVPISLNGDSIQAVGTGVKTAGTTLSITAAGTYRLSGELIEGKINVDAGDDAIVRLILDGVELGSSTGSPLHIISADKVVIILADGAVNKITDASEYTFQNADTDEPNAAIYSAADLTITGKGTLKVEGNYNDGIASKDGFIIAGGTVKVKAVDDGIRGKDYVVVRDASLQIESGGDGIKSDNEEDAARGYVWIESGIVDIAAGRDGIDAATDVIVSGGNIQVSSGGGSTINLDESTSAKGIKGTVSVMIVNGAFTVDSADDAIHSNGSITIDGGDYDLATGDDGMHSDETLTINGGRFRIATSYEGLESAVITINAGDIEINSSDDGINVAGGLDASGMAPGTMRGGRMPPGSMTGPGQDAFAASGDYHLYIHGGTIFVNADGDGLDINGAVEMTDGLVLINGPTQNMNGALDYMAGFKISGGFLVAVGSAGMAMAPDQTSSQNSILINLSSAQPAGTVIHIENSSAENLLTFEPAKPYQSIAFSSPQLINGETYQIYLGGSANGTTAGGLYLDGTYTHGKEYAAIDLTGVVTLVGNAGMMGGSPRRP